ncbi:MAG: hypothetical protein PF569_00880 [Candidatus Woesearchaeota archaeon]|jgi:hypothetical protein|nr:hypothetical protein [Candidatus Woesearchaeota archaeon]
MTEFEMKQSKYENYNDLDTIIDTVYENQSNTDTAREQNTTFESQENKKFPVTIF